MGLYDGGIKAHRQRPIKLESLDIEDGGITFTLGGSVVLQIEPAGSEGYPRITAGKLLLKQISGANPSATAAGTEGEVAYNTTDDKLAICTNTGAAGAATWKYMDASTYS